MEDLTPAEQEEIRNPPQTYSSLSLRRVDPKEFRHYGPLAQDFFAAFGHDGIGQIGTETTINSGDIAGILMIAVQALEKRTAELIETKAQVAALAARLDAIESRQKQSVQITAEQR